MANPPVGPAESVFVDVMRGLHGDLVATEVDAVYKAITTTFTRSVVESDYAEILRITAHDLAAKGRAVPAPLSRYRSE